MPDLSNTPSPQSSLDRHDAMVLDSFNTARAFCGLPPVLALPGKEGRPGLKLVQGGAA